MESHLMPNCMLIQPDSIKPFSFWNSNKGSVYYFSSLDPFAVAGSWLATAGLTKAQPPSKRNIFRFSSINSGFHFINSSAELVIQYDAILNCGYRFKSNRLILAVNFMMSHCSTKAPVTIGFFYFYLKIHMKGKECIMLSLAKSM